VKRLLIFFLLVPGLVFASEPPQQVSKQPPVKIPIVPGWQTAKKAMTECYDGWNVVVKLKGGLEQRLDWNDYTDENVYSSLEDQTDTDDTESSSSYTSSTERYDAEYSRDRSRQSAYVGVTMEVPLYSRATRLARKEATNKQIEHLADLYANFDGHRASMLALLEEKEVLKKVMIDHGQKGISSYYSLLQEIEKQRALMHSSSRKILAILENCDYVAKNEIARAR